MRHLSFICFMFVILDYGISFEDRVRSPLGLKMCNMLCRHTYGCSQFVFSRSHLTCCVACQQSDLRGLTVLVNNTEFQDRAVEAPCYHMSVIIYRRTGTPRCAKVVPSMKRGRNVEVLITQHKTPWPSAVYRYSVTQRSYDVHTNMTFKFVRAMSYSSTARTLLSSSAKPDRIVITYLDNSSLKLVKGNVHCSAMTLDTSRGIFLLAIVNRHLQIYTLAVNGTSFKHLLNIRPRRFRGRNRPSAMVMDPKRDLMYLCLPAEILSVDYYGIESVVFRGRSLHGLALNPSENALYFGNSMYIKRLVLYVKQVQTYIDLQELLFSILYPEDHLVYNLRVSSLVYSTHVKNTNIISSFKIRQLPEGQQLVMCPIR